MSAIDWRALQGNFPENDLEWRVQTAGEKQGRVWALCVPYITNRAIQQRLDDVVGPERWKNEFKPGPDGGVLCGISIRVGDEWVTKWDGAENTDIEPVKGGLSGSMKRAAVMWGLGRTLYLLDEMFAEVNENGKHRGKTRDGTSFRWNPPKLPAWATAAGSPSIDPNADGLAALLDYITTHAKSVGKEAVLSLNGDTVNFRHFVQNSWSYVISDPSVAEAVAKVVEQETGVKRDG